MPIEDIHIIKGVSFVCPFCNGTVAMGDLSDGGVGAIHTLPFCSVFDHLSVDEFAYASRVAIEAKMKAEKPS
jgi:hypothetical protein